AQNPCSPAVGLDFTLCGQSSETGRSAPTPGYDPRQHTITAVVLHTATAAVAVAGGEDEIERAWPAFGEKALLHSVRHRLRMAESANPGRRECPAVPDQCSHLACRKELHETHEPRLAC